jgi:hypothetical protein
MTSRSMPAQARVLLPAKISAWGAFFPAPVRVVIFEAAKD